MIHTDLNGRVEVITGGARRIGYAVAKRMLRSGGSIALWDSDLAPLKATEASCLIGSLNSMIGSTLCSSTHFAP
jgi:NAD(P)-dependent dehydrogenase (short-subunit alcohol dehydrogenase family)